MASYNTVVFDLGGVLIDWNPLYVYRTIFKTEDEIRWFFENITTNDWNEEQDAGRSLAAGTELLVKQFPEHEANIRAYYDRWVEMLGGPIEGTVQTFADLKKNADIKTYALTNWSAETFPVALQKYSFLHWFDGRVVSGEEKTRKPFPEIYKTLISRFDIDPKKAVYVDDNARNLHPARDLGFHAIHFLNPGQFRTDLESIGLL